MSTMTAKQLVAYGISAGLIIPPAAAPAGRKPYSPEYIANQVRKALARHAQRRRLASASTLQGSSVVERHVHTVEAAGSIPAPAPTPHAVKIDATVSGSGGARVETCENAADAAGESLS